MKKKLKLLFLLTIALASLGFVGCKDGENSSTDSSSSSSVIEIEELCLNETKIELALGETFALTASNIVGEIVWSSNDSAVASVDGNGLVTPVGLGTTIIKAKDSATIAMCQVTVVGARTENLLTLQMNKTALLLCEGDSYALTATVKDGPNVVEGTLTFESKDTTKAAVSQSGLVTAVSEGQTEIVVTANYEGKTAKANVTVSVSKNKPVLAFGVNESQIICGEEMPLSVYLMNGSSVTELDNAQVTYTVSNESLASVENGNLLALKKGKLDVMASYALDGETLQAKISLRLRERYSVKYYVDGVLWYETSVLDGESVDDIAPIPTHETYQFCAWESKEDETAFFSEKVAYDFSTAVQCDLTLQAEWYSEEQKLFAFDQGVAGATKNWQMNAAGTDVSYTTEKAYGEETGSLKIATKWLAEYPGSPADVYLGALNLMKCQKIWFYIYNTQNNNYYFDGDWANKVYLSADDTWKKVELMPMLDGKVLVSINGMECIYDDLKDLSTDGFSIHPADIDSKEELCYTYVSAVYGIKELDGGAPILEDSNGNAYVASASDVYTDGLQYTASQGYGESVLYLPTINFSQYSEVSFEWSIPGGWTFIGPDKENRYYMQGDALGGRVTIVKNGNGTLTLTMTQTAHSGATNVFTQTIDDEAFINGAKPLTLSINCLVGTKAIHIGNFVAK